MTDRVPMYQVALYLRGDVLDPDQVTSLLGVQPSKAHRKGEERRTPTNQKYLTKIGLWSLAAKSGGELSELLDELSRQLSGVEEPLKSLAGVQDAYVDIFIAVDADNEGGGTWEAELSADSIRRLSALGLPMRFTATVVRE
jgi:hypothetical protein